MLEILDGDATVVARLAASEDADVVAHVGSSATRRSIARAWAKRGRQGALENGGNDPLIVNAGLDAQWAAEQAALGAFANAGQICVSVEGICSAASSRRLHRIAGCRGPARSTRRRCWRALPVGAVKINAVFGGAPGGAVELRPASGSGLGFGRELLDEMTAMKGRALVIARQLSRKRAHMRRSATGRQKAERVAVVAAPADPGRIVPFADRGLNRAGRTERNRW